MDRAVPVKESYVAGDTIKVYAPGAAAVSDTQGNHYSQNGDVWESVNSLPLIAGVDMITVAGGTS